MQCLEGCPWRLGSDADLSLFASPAAAAGGPAEALAGAERQRHFRLRRQRDPLGVGHPCTWRTLLIKVATEVIVRTRRIVVRLSSSCPHLDKAHAADQQGRHHHELKQGHGVPSLRLLRRFRDNLAFAQK